MYPAFRPDFRHRAADLVRSLALVILAAFVAACSGDSGTPGGGSPSGTGSVGIFFTDSPSDEFDQILVTVEGIVLIGGGPQVTLFSGGATIDLKQIEKFSDLFVFADHVPARSYSKIRLNVSGIKLVNINDPDDEGDDDVIDVKVGGHKIDFVPRGKFEVHPGQALMLEIDMDADKMLKR
ncbi:MAG: DUF4382 domain-containing protein, partial [Deltaproteobacteria bacterium]|nr:DUF4382 domain-containing protein [Deltaproteobacteria bacterium]